MVFRNEFVYFLRVPQVAHITKDVADLPPDVVFVSGKHLHQSGHQVGEKYAFLYLMERSCADIGQGPAGFSSDGFLLMV